MLDPALVIVRARCTLCGEYGRCAIGKCFDGRELFVGVDCDCIDKDIERRKQLRKQGSINVPYC